MAQLTINANSVIIYLIFIPDKSGKDVESIFLNKREILEI